MLLRVVLGVTVVTIDTNSVEEIEVVMMVVLMVAGGGGGRLM